jgi:hypothetical protein
MFQFIAKIPSSHLHRRRRYKLPSLRRSFSDDELEEILTYKELVRLRLRVPVTGTDTTSTMAERTFIPSGSRPVPTFSDSKREDVPSFIEAIECAYQRERACYDDETAPIAKKSLLVEGCKGKAAKYVKGLGRDKKDSWEHLVAALREKYESPNAEDRAKCIQKAMKLYQKSDEDLSTYARRAKKLAGKVEAAYDNCAGHQE